MFEKPLGLRENPFLAGHHPKYLFPSREHQEALAHLRYGIQNREPFVLITGEVGTGKTTAVYDALAEWGSRAVVALITNSALTRSELLEEICLRFGVAAAAPMSKPQALVELQKQLSAVRGRGELAILLVDEAQNLDRELLEEIRLLSNLEVNGEYLLQIFLVGQPELENKLAQKELRQLRQRIGIHYRILPLSVAETARYIHHRVSVAGGNAEELFPSDTCVEIFRITNGIPREINIVAGQALLNAFVEEMDHVTPDHTRAVEREIEFQSVLRRGPADELPAPARPATAAPPPAARPEPARPTPQIVPPPAPVVPLPQLVRPAGSPPADEMELEDEVTAPPTGYSAEEGLEESDIMPAEPARELAPVREHPRRRATDMPAPVTVPAAASAASPAPEPASEPEPQRPQAILPPWFDEIVARRQAMFERGTEARELSAVAFSAPPPAAQATDPESEPAIAPAAAAAVAGHVPPERIAPHPSEPSPVSARLDLISARLRAKLDENGEPLPARRPAFGPLVASLVIAALAIGVLLLVRFGPWTAPPKGQADQPSVVPGGAPGTPGPGGATAESTVAGALAPSTATPAAPIDAPSPAVSSPPSRPAGAPSAGTSPAGTANAGPVAGSLADSRPARTAAPSFDVAVGTYLNEARALAERTRLAESTTFPTRVVTLSEDNASMYRVVVGPFTDRLTAERAASDLVQRGLVNEARVVMVAQSAPRPR